MTGTPPTGTICIECRCCPAAIYAGNEPLCWDCDEGRPCKRGTKAAQAAGVEPAASDHVEKQEVSEEGHMPQGSNKTPDHIRDAVIEAGYKLSARELAEKHGISDSTVFAIRREAGIVNQGRAGNKVQPPAAKPAPAHKNGALAHNPEPKSTKATISLEIEVDELALDRLWKSFDIEQKAEAIRGALLGRLQVFQQ